MKRQVCLLILFISIGFSSSLLSQCNGLCDYFKIEPQQFNACQDTHYVLKFEDQFDGNQINKDKWQLIGWRQGASFGGSELQVNTMDPDNLEVSEGTLKIKLDNKPKEKKQVDWQPVDKRMEDSVVNLRTYLYSSSNIWTKQNDFGPGKYEIRFRMDKLDGMWPAFWTYSGDGPTPGGSRWNEFDIFEVFCKNGQWDFTTNVHYDYENDGTNENNFCPSHEKRKDLDEWHVVTCYFTDRVIAIYLDEELMEKKYKFRTFLGLPVTCDKSKRKARREMYGWPRETGHLILNMSLQNLEKGISTDPNAFPCVFEVDYVKYWVLDNENN